MIYDEEIYGYNVLKNAIDDLFEFGFTEKQVCDLRTRVQEGWNKGYLSDDDQEELLSYLDSLEK